MRIRQLGAAFVLTCLLGVVACRSHKPVVLGFSCPGLGPAELLVATAIQTTEPSTLSTHSRLRVVLLDSANRRLLPPHWVVLASDSLIPSESAQRPLADDDSVATFDSLTAGRYYVLLRHIGYRPRRGWVTLERGHTLELTTLMTRDVIC